MGPTLGYLEPDGKGLSLQTTAHWGLKQGAPVNPMSSVLASLLRRLSTWTPKLRRIITILAILNGFGQLFYIRLGSMQVETERNFTSHSRTLGSVRFGNPGKKTNDVSLTLHESADPQALTILQRSCDQ